LVVGRNEFEDLLLIVDHAYFHTLMENIPF